MKRHDIRFRKQEFATNRIKQYKDYKQLMRQHHRANRSRTIVHVAIGMVVLVFITTVVYLNYSTLIHDGPFMEEKIQTHEVPQFEVLEFEELVVNVVGEPATPEGGLKAYGNYIQREMIYPQAAKEAGIAGIVNVQFLVKPDGSPTDFRIINSLGYGCDEEAIRLIREGPKWKFGNPDTDATQSGMIVPVIFVNGNY